VKKLVMFLSKLQNVSARFPKRNPFVDRRWPAMNSALADEHDPRTLVLDANIPRAQQLVEQLTRAGFRPDFALTCDAARAAFKDNCYHSCVVSVDLTESAGVAQLDELRVSARRVWPAI
jgi:DNA-binding response OmpR family regulator